MWSDCSESIFSKKIAGLACLLPDFFENIKNKKNYSKNIYNELNLISACVFADQAISKEKKIKIKYIR